MELNNIADFNSVVADRFEPEEIEDLEMLLHPSNLDPNDLNYLETALGTVLPDDFRHFIMTYELGRFSIGWVSFGADEKYVDALRESNVVLNRSMQWWDGDQRPANFIFIAGTDGYSILLDLRSGEVFAFLQDLGSNTRQKIATDFTTFIRGAATLYLGYGINPEVTFQSVSVAAGADSDSRFWYG